MSKKLLTMLTILVGFLSCEEPTDKKEPFSEVLTSTKGCISKLGLTDGRFQDFVVYYEDLKTKKEGKFKTKEISWCIGDTVTVIIEEYTTPHGVKIRKAIELK